MSNLIESDTQGNWGIKGVPWDKLHVGRAITPAVNEKLYGCLCKLKDYESTGLSPEQVESLKEKATAEKLRECKITAGFIYQCPVCDNIIAITGEHIPKPKAIEYCWKCGQKIAPEQND